MKIKCKYCGKVIESLYQSQLDYNLQAHEISCLKKTNGELKAVRSADASNSKTKKVKQ